MAVNWHAAYSGHHPAYTYSAFPSPLLLWLLCGAETAVVCFTPGSTVDLLVAFPPNALSSFLFFFFSFLSIQRLYSASHAVFILLLFFLIQYITIIEHVSTPVPTVDNIRIQIYKYMLCIHNRQNDTSIQTKSWTKYFIDRYLPCTMSDWFAER